MAINKRVTLHPLKTDGTVETKINLYPKTFVDGIIDRDGNPVELATVEELNQVSNSVEIVSDNVSHVSSEVEVITAEVANLSVEVSDLYSEFTIPTVTIEMVKNGPDFEHLEWSEFENCSTPEEQIELIDNLFNYSNGDYKPVIIKLLSPAEVVGNLVSERFTGLIWAETDAETGDTQFRLIGNAIGDIYITSGGSDYTFNMVQFKGSDNLNSGFHRVIKIDQHIADEVILPAWLYIPNLSNSKTEKLERQRLEFLMMNPLSVTVEDNSTPITKKFTTFLNLSYDRNNRVYVVSLLGPSGEITFNLNHVDVE